MFRLAPVVLLAASLSSVATAQNADQKNQIKQAPADGTVSNTQPANGDQPPADGTMILEPSDYGPSRKALPP